jgi:uncharacterized glyoxalase superfamily protein PhnB
MQTITPYLYYEDVDAALEWLARAFGLEECGKRFTGPNGKTNHAAMKLNDGVVMMGGPSGSYRNPKRLKRGRSQVFTQRRNLANRSFLRHRLT